MLCLMRYIDKDTIVIKLYIIILSSSGETRTLEVGNIARSESLNAEPVGKNLMNFWTFSQALQPVK